MKQHFSDTAEGGTIARAEDDAKRYGMVGQQGVVRYVQVGHSEDLEQRFAEVIERLIESMGTGTSGTR
jgi:hypothetical protein